MIVTGALGLPRTCSCGSAATLSLGTNEDHTKAHTPSTAIRPPHSRRMNLPTGTLPWMR